jgi:hypothetical protein
MTIQFFKSFASSLLLVSLFSFAVACHSHADDTDVTNPVLTIKSPTSGDNIPGPITIKGDVSDESLHELSIIVKKDSDKSELFKATPVVHDLTTFSFLETWTPTGLDPETAVTLSITIEDHNANKTEQSISFKVK